MKTFALAALLVLSAIVTASAIPVGVYPVMGPANFRFLAYGQDASFQRVTSKTNITSTATNITLVYKSSVTNTVLDTDAVLALLENSFATNFPAGARLYLSGNSFYVMDSTGTNLVLNVSSVLSLHLHPHVIRSGVEVVNESIANGGVAFSGKDSELTSEVFDINYSDNGLSPTDGTATTFQITGLVALKYQRDLQTGRIQTAFVLTGQGDGVIQNYTKIIRGALTSNGVMDAVP